MNQIESSTPINLVGSGESTASNQIGSRDDFLRLLVAQMRFQDPLNPLEGSEFTAQLAQFSSLEQLQNIGSQLDQSVDADLLLARSINNTMAATLIGKSVRAADNQVAWQKDPVQIDFQLDSAAGGVVVEITTEQGEVVRTLTASNLQAGVNSIIWDGRDSRGNRAPEGNYRVRITATAPGSDQAVDVQPLVIGKVTGVKFIDGNPVLIVNGREIAFGSVLEILDPTDE